MIQADPADVLGSVNNYSLVELIIETGIHDAIAQKLNQKGRLSNNAVAEGIINNVRKTIIREQLTDPRFYEEMSKLLDDLIQQQRDDTASYEEFLRKAEALVKKLAGNEPDSENIPYQLHDKPEAIVLFNNLEPILADTVQVSGQVDDTNASLQLRTKLALDLDQAMREHAPAGWLGDDTREKQVLNALFPILSRNREATLAIFEIIKNQPGYQ